MSRTKSENLVETINIVSKRLDDLKAENEKEKQALQDKRAAAIEAAEKAREKQAAATIAGDEIAFHDAREEERNSNDIIELCKRRTDLLTAAAINDETAADMVQDLDAALEAEAREACKEARGLIDRLRELGKIGDAITAYNMLRANIDLAAGHKKKIGAYCDHNAVRVCYMAKRINEDTEKYCKFKYE